MIAPIIAHARRNHEREVRCADRVCRAGTRIARGPRGSATHVRRVEWLGRQSLLDQPPVPVVRDGDQQDARRRRSDRSGFGRLRHRHDHQIGVDHRADGVYAGVSVTSGQTGIAINGAGAIVVLRGLSINGVAAGSVNGIHLVQASRLRIESCIVAGLASTGILHDAVGAELVALDTIVRDNGGAGIAINVDANVVLDHLRVEHNAGDGLNVSASAAVARVDIRNSVFSHNGFSGVAAFIPSGIALTEVVIEDSVISQNGVDGIFAGGISDGFLVVTLRRNSIAGNGSAGVSAFSGGGGGVAEVHATENTFLRNVLTATKADGPSVRVYLSHNVFAYALSGLSFYTVNGGQTLSWTDNVGYQIYFGTAISTQPRF